MTSHRLAYAFLRRLQRQIGHNSRYEGQRPYSPFRVLLGGPSVVRWMYVFYMADWNFFVS